MNGWLRGLQIALLGAACGDAPTESATVDRPAAPTLAAFRIEDAVAERAAVLDERIRARPDAIEPLVELAALFDASGVHGRAREAWADVTRLTPDDAKAWYHLARMHAEVGDADLALRAVDRAIELKPNYPPSHWRRGLSLLELDRLGQAEEAFGRAVMLAPTAVSGRVGLARVALQREDADRAIELLESVLVNHPRDGYVHTLMARACAQAGERERAERHLAQTNPATSAWKLDPWASELGVHARGRSATIRRAKAHVAGGRPAAAMAVLEPIIARFPGNFSAQSLFVGACVADGSLERARAVLDASDASLGQHYRTDVNRAVVEFAAGNADEALRLLDRALERNATHAPTHALRGRLLFEADRLEEAEGAFILALQHGDDALDTWFWLNGVQVQLGKREASLQTLREASSEFPTRKRLWVALVSAEIDSGNADGARDALDELRRLDPKPDMLAKLTARIDALLR